MFSGGIERDQCHEMGLGNFKINQIAIYIVEQIFLSKAIH